MRICIAMWVKSPFGRGAGNQETEILRLGGTDGSASRIGCPINAELSYLRLSLVMPLDTAPLVERLQRSWLS